MTAEYRYLEGLLAKKRGAPAEADPALAQAILAGEDPDRAAVLCREILEELQSEVSPENTHTRDINRIVVF